MKTKIYVGRSLIGRFNCDGRNYTRSQYAWLKIKEITKKTITISAITVTAVWILVGGIHLGKQFAPTVFAEKEVIKEVKAHAPVMDRILKCESGGTHVDPKTGQVLMRANKNGSIDIGKYQINSVWFKKATELGLNLSIEKDNESMAYYLYENFGTEDWYSSKACWDK